MLVPLSPCCPLQGVQRDLQAHGDRVSETVRGVEEFLAERGESLSPEERANLQQMLGQVREQYGSLTQSAQSSLVQLDSAISTAVQQHTQRVRRFPHAFLWPHCADSPEPPLFLLVLLLWFPYLSPFTVGEGS